MIIRPMREEEEPAVRVICGEIDHGACLEDRPLGWHITHPTLVAEVEGRIVGYTGYTVEQGHCMVWTETCVTEGHRGQGIGRALMEARLARAREAGCSVVTGVVKDDNEPMVHLLQTLGLHACQRIAGASEDMMVYARHVGQGN